MRPRISPLLMLMFVAIARPAFAVPTVTSRHLTLTSLNGRYVQHVDFPQVGGLANPAVMKRINVMLRKSWPREDLTATDLDRGEAARADVKFTVRLNAHGVLSISFSGLMGVTRGGKIATAHPTKLINACTVNLATGHVYTWAELFKPGAKYDAVIAKRVTDAIGADPDEQNPHQRSFYLTPTSLVVIFPDAPFAVQGAEVAIPLKALASFANPSGPLK